MYAVEPINPRTANAKDRSVTNMDILTPLTFEAFDEMLRQIPRNSYVEICTLRGDDIRGWVPEGRLEENLRRCEKLNNWCYLRLQTPAADGATERRFQTHAFAVNTVATVVWR